MQYTLEGKKISLEYRPGEFGLTVSVRGSDVKWSWLGIPFVHLASGEGLDLSRLKCESKRHDTGTSVGVKAVYSGFTGSDGKEYPFELHTCLKIDLASDRLISEFHFDGDALGEVANVGYPPRMEFNALPGEGYTVLPRMQGTIVPAGEPIEVQHGIVGERNAYMPLFGQINKGCGYAMIIETPYDSRYRLEGENIQLFFIPSLGKMAYTRGVCYSFFPEGDFNTVAKIYRKYLSERGEFVTLKEKLAKNPKAERIIGLPIVHTGIAHRIHPQSHFYNAEQPEKNEGWCTFDQTGQWLRELKERGLDEAYLHLDGWGYHGYDNLHPDPFPVHEGAGGAEGMRRLMDTCHDIGFMFGIHDQYRDYYYDAPSFDINNAISDINGEHPYHDYWFGGPHSFLCAKLAKDYVRRNYDEFERLGIMLDGSYLDVFSVVEMDECFNPDHPMTRCECARARRMCLDLLTDRGIIPSSEEVLSFIINSMVLCHHAPFYTTDWEDRENAENIGIPIPLLNLVYHECVIIPWYGIHQKGAWGIAGTDRGYYWALLCGDTIYCDIDASSEDIEYGKTALELNRRVAHCELVRHEFVDGNYRCRRSVFSDGTEVVADFDKEIFTIRYPDGRVVEGK